MSHTLIASALLATMLPAAAAPGRLSTPSEVRKTLGNNLSFSLVGAPGAQQVLLIGTIDEAMSKAFREILSADPDIHTVLLDSYGGNIDSAMDIAALIRQRKLRLVVDGRCLSACANYLFPAAVSKTVLPGSVVAIHGLSTLYYEDGKAKWVTESQARDLFRSASRASDRQALQQRMQRHGAFYQQIGLRPDAHSSFARYLAHRKELFGSDQIDSTQRAFDCPPIQMWALDQQQWQAMGVKGIESYWYPADAEQQRQLLRSLNMPADYFYYGSAAGIEQLCQPSLMARIKHWFAIRD